MPILEVGRQLVASGHEVTMVTGSGFADLVEHAGMSFVPLTGAADFDERDPQTFTPDIDRLSGLALSRHQVLGTFVQPIPDQARALATALQVAGHVDAVLVDATFAGVVPLLGHPAGSRPRVVGLGTLPLAQSSVDVPPYNSGIAMSAGPFARVRNRVANAVVQRMLFRSVQHTAVRLVGEVGGDLRLPVLDLSRMFDAFVQLCPEGFEYARRDLSDNVVFGGPILPADDAVQPPGWWDEVGSSGRPIIHVTQGTLDNHDFTQLVVPTLEAMKSLDVHVVVSTGGAPIDTITSPVPSNAVVAEHIDYRWLLPRTSVLVTNGGYGTVQQALAHGVPVVVAPGGEDKPEVAARVGYFRTGVDLGTRRPTPGQIRDAIQTATTDSVIRDNVRAFAVSARSYDPIAVVTEAAQLILGTPGEADTDEMERTS
ncbi:nucleotide disphospho-sugar-binding domain-containing protein [Rhodococcus sp. P1Y]|uniref:nucleotide disphospho-sugar-binding domain-containing protein n=1 Tax=Rhodococcus sp. P1Y TaxID=1302308 RepID=UPI000EACF8B4|nr:nucleotide disphospho-sugar-binding domain-containing protein [Rhodococcus sp. P1Y]AYJ47041.1 glycosyltransferase [Rhodococcus sp. P1Y]